MLHAPKQSSLPADLKRVSSAQFKAFQQVHIRRIGRIRLWLLSLIASLITTVVVICLLRKEHTWQGHERQMNTTMDAPFLQGCGDPIAAAAKYPREDAAFVILARNSELENVLHSMSSLEIHFNQWFEYPYVFLNNEPFSDAFKAGVRQATNAKMSFGQVNASMWGFPAWADQRKYKEAIAQQGDRAIMYGGLESYHHMCRFFSGFFFNHPLVKDLEYYWRVEPDVTFFCDLTYDPFRMMKQQGKVYGFVIAIKELVETVPNMFRYASAWKRKHSIKDTSLWPFMLKERPKKPSPPTETPATKEKPDPLSGEQKEISPDRMEGDAYNMCHFWSNFEIARVDFFQSDAYTSFFQEMDKSGGFWLERWGDAPIHTLGAALLLEADQVHYFRDIGYQHTDIMHCPANAPKQGKRPPTVPLAFKEPEPAATKAPADNAKKEALKIEREQLPASWDRPKSGGSGCRCTCPHGFEEVEWKDGTCMNEWAQIMGGWLD
ncbi:nucleotide-diphospho-sugar transferase [Protomyces lactucae-debilis]|uniref:Nucleotide-diphospho-sugar transferase n=1 Tax=Protomyces lactucae-debilis TaxID=2754530 RepID=A0A1Y2FSI7_PROLT|nr:nucleotide-diphospho-sugar transferase [Protomyces lactucae-debilis]ORY86274.1 nucleotide-diphospho-sugar transferase [Protomyces lactucae-debilis]